MIFMQEEEEVVDKRENKRFRGTHGEMVVEVKVLVGNILMAIITKASYYVYNVISSTSINIHAIETNISKAGVAIMVRNIHDA